MILRYLLALTTALALCSTARAQWSVVSEPTTINPDSFYGIACADSLHCIAYGDAAYSYPRVKRSTDGGRSWEWMLNPQPDLSGETLPLRPTSAAHPTPSLMLLSVAHRRMLRSTNAGATWDTVHIPELPENWTIGGRVTMFDAEQGVLIYGAAHHVFRTSDGGATWTRSLANPVPAERGFDRDIRVFSAVSFSVLTSNLASDSTWIYRTNDGGISWTSSLLPTITPFSAFVFSDESHGWAIGGNNTVTNGEVIIRDIIVRTTDGGETWAMSLDSIVISEHTPQSWGVFAIDAFDERNVLAVGHRGKILRTTDAGATWRTERSGMRVTGDGWSMALLKSVAFTSATTAIAGGWESVILRYEEGISGVIDQGARVDLLPYPNPTMGRILVHVHEPMVGAVLEIHDLLGRTVYRTRAERSVNALDVSHLSPGSYRLVVSSEREVVSSSLVLVR